MSSIVDEQTKVDFLNRVVDITAKINSAVDDLIMLTDQSRNYFSESDAKLILGAIENIASTTTKLLISAIDSVAPGESDKLQALDSKMREPQAHVLNSTSDPEILNKLPEVAVEIVSLIGIHSAMKLFKSFGGTTFPIGKGIRYLGGSHANALRTILTEDEIKKMVWYFSGSTIYLPRCDRLLREVRNREFINEFTIMRKAGSSAIKCMSVLPPKYGFTDRYGWQLLKKERESEAAKITIN